LQDGGGLLPVIDTEVALADFERGLARLGKPPGVRKNHREFSKRREIAMKFSRVA